MYNIKNEVLNHSAENFHFLLPPTQNIVLEHVIQTSTSYHCGLIKPTNTICTDCSLVH